jgi:glycosyltransferase involved in cell wall biosynthesis
MSIPIITTDNVGCRDVVKDGINGFLCIRNSLDSVYEKMKQVLSMNVEDLGEMGRQGRSLVVEKFDEGHILRIYDEVLKYYLV